MSETRPGTIITFYSFKGGTGRSMALANVAWILAAAGRRVLVADWDLDSPGLHRFFSPFLQDGAIEGQPGVIDLLRGYEDATTRGPLPADDVDVVDDQGVPPWVQELARVQRYAVSVDWSFPDGGTLDMLLAGRQNPDYASSITGLDWDVFYDRLHGARFLDALRQDMKRAYDYVLIDSRTGLSDIAQICIEHLPDTLVACFTLSNQGIDGAAEIARKVAAQVWRPDGDGIRVLPVAMRVDQAEKEKAEAGRALAVRRFEGLPRHLDTRARSEYWNAVEVPYQAYYNYEETLATFGDTPGAANSLLAAYEKLTGYVTNGAVQRLDPMPEAVRLRYKRLYQRRVSAPLPRVSLQYAAEDQVWAEWVTAVLGGVDVEVLDPGPVDARGAGRTEPTEVPVLYLVSSRLRQALREAVPPPAPPAEALAVLLSDVRLADRTFTQTVDIAHLDAEQAVQELLTLVGQEGHPRARTAGQSVRFPRAEPRWTNLPARSLRFTGRTKDLRRLREVLTGHDQGVATIALRGLGGVGKTQLALEYAHRFKAAYELIWWIPSDQAQFLDAAVIELAGRLGLRAYPDPAQTVRATLESLRLGETTDRWLIVFDNAEDVAAVADLLPRGGRGHVLITSRNRDWEQHAYALPVEVFTRDESVQHLLRVVPSLSEAEAHDVAEELGDLPLAVDLAGAWLAATGTSAAEFVRRLEESLPSLSIPAGSDTDAQSRSLTATFELSLRRLQEEAPAAHRLLEICAVMDSEIAFDLLSSDQMARELLPLDPSLSDKEQRATLRAQLHRLSLLTVDTQQQQVVVHRLVQAVIRFRLSPQDLAARQHAAHLVLAAARPSGEVDDPRTWDQWRTIWYHLEPSAAVECDVEAVRQLLIDRLRYVWLRGDRAQGVAFGTKVASIWAQRLARLPEGNERADLQRQLLNLRFNLANIYRDRGDFLEAMETDVDVLAQQTQLLGPTHAHTLMTAGGYAADLRALGRYQEALERDLQTSAAWKDRFGVAYPRTLSALNNLATSWRAVGKFATASELDDEVQHERIRALGPYHELTLHSGIMLGRDLREAGRYEDSLNLLRQVLHDCLTRLPDHAENRRTLLAKANLATSLRSAGMAQEAMELVEDALAGFTRQFGAEGSETVACRMNRALNLLSLGEAPVAVAELHAVAEVYERRLGPLHPFTLVAKSNESAARRAAGQLDEARALAEAAAEGCEQVLGIQHPFSLAAVMNLAGCLNAQGDAAVAAGLVQRVADTMLETLGPDHPDTLTSQLNLELLRRQGPGHETPQSRQARAKLEQLLGRHHPTLVELREGRTSYRLLDAVDPF